MKIVGIIPSRYNSSRFPGKPLIDLKGKSMIQRVYENARKSKSLSEVIVATDDKRIFDHVKQFGGNVAMTSQNHLSGTERCGELAKLVDADVIINIQGDEPLINPQQLDDLATVFECKKVNIATLGSPNITLVDLMNPNRVKIVTNQQNNAIYFSRSVIPNNELFHGDAMSDYPYLKHIGMYAFRKSILLDLIDLKPSQLEQIESLEQLRWLYYGYEIYVVNTTIETPNIDVPEDIEKVLAMLD